MIKLRKIDTQSLRKPLIDGIVSNVNKDRHRNDQFNYNRSHNQSWHDRIMNVVKIIIIKVGIDLDKPTSMSGW